MILIFIILVLALVFFRAYIANSSDHDDSQVYGSKELRYLATPQGKAETKEKYLKEQEEAKRRREYQDQYNKREEELQKKYSAKTYTPTGEVALSRLTTLPILGGYKDWHDYDRVMIAKKAEAEEKHKEKVKQDEHKLFQLQIRQEEQRVKASTAGKLIERSKCKIAPGHTQYGKAGVYMIVNIKTSDFYIGESQNMEFRRKTHLGDMLDGTHHRPLIQKHFDQYGKDVFDFYIIKRTNTMDDQARKAIEEFYIEEYNPTYN